MTDVQQQSANSMRLGFVNVDKTTSQATKWLAACIFVVSVAAFVVLTLFDKPTDGLMVLVGPVVSALVVTAVLGNRMEPIKQSVEQVKNQTNGALDLRIRAETEAAVRQVMGEHLGSVPAPGTKASREGTHALLDKARQVAISAQQQGMTQAPTAEQ